MTEKSGSSNSPLLALRHRITLKRRKISDESEKSSDSVRKAAAEKNANTSKHAGLFWWSLRTWTTVVLIGALVVVFVPRQLRPLCHERYERQGRMSSVSNEGWWQAVLSVFQPKQPQRVLDSPVDVACVIVDTLSTLPSSSEAVSAFVWLAYPVDGPFRPLPYASKPSIVHTNPNFLENWMPLYEKGLLDIHFIVGLVLFLSLVRSVTMALLFRFARWQLKRNRISDENSKKTKQNSNNTRKSLDQVKKVVANDTNQPMSPVGPSSLTQEKLPLADRFADQFFLFMHHSLSFSVGLYIVWNSPIHPIHTNGFHMWTDYPLNVLPALTKIYYLTEMAFWIQQLILHSCYTPAQARRKDHWAMGCHHIVTIALVSLSYVTHMTRAGTLVMITMDAADILLSLAKSIKYIRPKWKKTCDVVFVLFTLVWIITRHGLYLWVMYATYAHPELYITEQRFDPWIFRMFSDGDRPGTYFTTSFKWFYLSCFAALQGLLLFWFALILKVIYKVVTGTGADDVREDDD